MQTIIIISLVFLIVALLLWIFRLKKEIKEHHLFEHELVYEAEHDPLTGLANGLLFIDRLSQSIKNAARFKKKIAILYLGLDDFTKLNDSYGSSTGDKVLQEMGKKIQGTLRESDTVARLGGDEFIIILDHFEDASFIRSVSDKIMKLSRTAFLIDDQKIEVRFSLGISVYPDDTLNSQTLLKNASVIMRKVKDNGKNNYQFFTEEFAQKAAKRKKLEQQLLESIDKGQMQVYYQLQINSSNLQIQGMEALIRWNHPVHGLLLPDEFLPLAKEINFIHILEDWVMKTSVAQFELWHKEDLKTGSLCLNLSTQRLKKAYFIRSIGELINKNTSLKEYLKFELAENQVMQDVEEYTPYINKLARLGIKLNLDKFGLGCSSVMHLKSLAISELKLEASLINNEEVTFALIALAKKHKHTNKCRWCYNSRATQ
ncbi:MAG: diguanylate cyclase [Sulfurimonas sp.]|nr:diguanylate cyclase [Sulfurimonas sp.]